MTKINEIKRRYADPTVLRKSTQIRLFFMNAQEFDLFDVGSMKFTTFQWGGPINSIQTSFVTNVKVMQQLAQLASPSFTILLLQDEPTFFFLPIINDSLWYASFFSDNNMMMKKTLRPRSIIHEHLNTTLKSFIHILESMKISFSIYYSFIF